MRSWQILFFSVAILAFSVGGGNRALEYAQWWMDGHLAIAEAKDALEDAGVEDVDNNITVIAPDGSRMGVAGHVRTKGGTLPFYVRFGIGSDYRRQATQVVVGRRVLLPSPPSTDKSSLPTAPLEAR